MATVRSLAACIALLLVAAPVHAGGFATARFGGEHGHPTTDSPTAIYYNPAGLALGQGTRLFIESLLVYRSASYDRPPEAIDNITDTGQGTPTEAIGANAGEATLGNFLASPFLGAVTDFGVPNLGVGLAFFVPFGGQASWDRNEDWEGSEQYPGAVDGVQRWSTIEGEIRELFLSASAAYRLPEPRLSFGLAVNVIREEVNTVRARLPTGTDDLVGPDGRIVEGRSLVDTSNTTLSLGAGVIWEPLDQLWLGLSYQSQPGFGASTQQGTLTNKFGQVPVDSSEIDLRQDLPDIVRLGGRYRPTPRSEIRLSGDYTRWSVMDDQCLTDALNPNAECALDEDGGLTAESEGVIVNINRDWQDTFGVRGGGSYWPTPELEIAGGIAYDSNAVPDDTLDAALMDMNKLIGVLGARYQLGQVLLNLSYTHVYYFTRTVEPRDMPPPAPSRVPDGAGTYSQTIGLLNVGALVSF